MAKRSRFSLFIGIGILGFLAFGLYQLFRDLDSPQITFSHQAETISPAMPLSVTVSDATSALKQVRIVARYQENVIPLLEQSFSDNRQSQTLTFSLANAGLKNGDVFDLEITAVDNSFGGFGFGNKERAVFPLRVDALPPRLSVKSSVPYVRRGGSACVVYSVSKEVRETGVQVNDLFFPAFRQDNGDYLCFFAFPHYLETKEFTPQLMAKDMAGNTQINALAVTSMPRKFKTDSIVVTQGFLDAKAVEFESIAPGAMTDIERFLKINGQVRSDNARELMEIGKNTAAVMLWKGAFLRLPRAAPRAGFADHRTYLWENQKVDEQTHLGFDLASVKQAPIPAANAGTVVFAGYLGIYGNLVIIDHGLGLQSLYSHMSEISVGKGQNLEKGQLIGKTGATGMAGGDHLHFGILISGLEVTPLEWLDDHWIKDNIIDRIIDAGGTAPTFELPPAPPAPPRNKKPQQQKKSR